MHYMIKLTAASPWCSLGVVWALVTSFRLLPANVDIPFRRPFEILVPALMGCLSLVLDASDLESSQVLRIRCIGMIGSVLTGVRKSRLIRDTFQYQIKLLRPVGMDMCGD